MSLGDLASVGREILRKHGPAGLIGAGVDFITRPVVQPLAAKSLRRRASAATSTPALVDLALDFRFGNVTVAAMQVRQEIIALAYW